MIAKIHNCYHQLTETEKRIADAVLHAPQAVIQMTVQELAACSGAAPSAVIRFCKSIGMKGFSDFKIALSSAMGGKENAAAMLPVHEGDDSRQVFSKVFTSGINALADTLNMIDDAQIKTIVQKLQNAARVVFFGVGTSSVIAVDAQYRFAQLGIPTAACTDILFMNVTAANLKKEDAAVCISHSGNTKATVNAQRRAQKAGAATIAITSYANSLLAQECDHKIIAFSDDQNYPVEAVSARIAHMCIVDALMMTLAACNAGELQKHMDERNEVLKEIRYKSK